MARNVEYILDEANPNKIPSGLQVVRAGKAMKLIPRFEAGTVTANVLTLPEDAKALHVLLAFARTGTATGWKIGVSPAATLAAGQVNVTPTGDIAFFGTDAVTGAEVWYIPMEGELVEDTIQVTAGGAGTLLGERQALRVLEAEVLTGAAPGNKTVVQRGATPAAGEAAATAPGQVAFNGADIAGTGGTARILYIARPNVGSALPSLGQRLALETAM